VILFPYAVDTRGGSVYSSFLLVEELTRRGRAAMPAFHGNGFARDLARQRGLQFIDLPALGSRAESSRKDGFRMGNLTSAPVCMDAIRKQEVQLVHVNDKRMLRTWSLPAKLTGMPLLAHWRSVYAPSWSVDLGLRLASRVVCVSAYSRDLLPAWARRKSEIVYNPFQSDLKIAERDAIRRQIREKARIPANAAVIGFFGSLLARKRAHVMIEILQRLAATADGRPIYGVVCGDVQEPRDERYFRLLASGGAWSGRLVSAGFVSNVAEWMAACDVMVAPAVDEPLARVGVEAQSAGLPAIVSSDGGLREVVEDGVSGLVVDPHDFETWVEKVRQVLDDAGFAQRLIDGGLRAAARLTVQRHADAIEAVYEHLLSRRQVAMQSTVSLPGPKSVE
jgi:glycosyltransferase involved in cell wall biosynthesis